MSRAQGSTPPLGAHMSVAGGLPKAVDRAVATGCDTFQIFTKSSNQWRARPLADTEIHAFRDALDASGLGPVVAHASYLINVASPDATLRRRSTASLQEELERADALGLAGVVLHPGAFTTSCESDGLRRIAESIGTVFARHPFGGARLLLEQMAGQGTVLGHRFEHLRAVIDAVDQPERLGVCLDTCHLFAAGYDLGSERGHEAVLAEFEAVVGLDRLVVFHLNDSKAPLGSRLDRHEHIGRGCLGTDPFARLLRDERLRDVPMILETAKAGRGAAGSLEADPMDLENLAVLRRLR